MTTTTTTTTSPTSPGADANRPLLQNNATPEEEEEEAARPPAGDRNQRTLRRNKSVVIAEKNNERKRMQKWKLVPPDGGWGWLVLLGSTLVNVLVPGTIKSFGVLLMEFIEAFDASSSSSMLIPALCYFLYSSLGPVSSILSVRFSYRTVTLVGGSFAAFGMILSFFADDIVWLYITFGIMVGTGAGLSFPPTVYIVTSYFVRLRGIANGICISGSALGSIFLPPLLRLILDRYGYRGAVLLIGGATLNVWVAALFYDPVEKHMKRVPVEPDEEASALMDRSDAPTAAKFTISADDSIPSSLHHIPRNDSFVDNGGAELAPGANFNRSASSAAFQSLKQSSGRERKISMPANTRTGLHSSATLHSVPEKQMNNGDMDMAVDLYAGRGGTIRRPRAPRRSPSTSSFQYVSTPYHGSTLTLQPETFASSFSLRSTATHNTGAKAEQPPKKKFFDLTVLTDPVYLIMLVSNATNAIGYTNFIILLPLYANELYRDKDRAAYLLSVVSMLDLVGRIGGSALSDVTKFPKCYYFIGGLFVSGVSLFVMPFFRDYSLIAALCGAFGLASGIYVGITAVVMSDMLGEERLQSTYGISLFVNGVLQLVGPVVCGKLRDRIGSYDPIFCTLGVVIVVGSLIWGFMPFVRARATSDGEE